MTYQSVAARKRIKRRNHYLRTRNTIIRYVGIVVFGVVGIGLGLLIVHAVDPNHPFFK